MMNLNKLKMKKIFFSLIIATFVFTIRKTMINLEFDPDCYLDFVIVTSAVFLGKYLVDLVFEHLHMFSMPLGPGNTNILNSNPPSRETSPNEGGSHSPSSNSQGNNVANAGTNSGNNSPAYSSDTNYSGNPASPGSLQDIIRETVAEAASNDPAHRIEDPSSVTASGYVGGGIFDNNSRHSSDSGLGNVNSVQPFARNLANYLEAYRQDGNNQYSNIGFPRMDERSLT